jgi:cation diffusion facilitator CzcD-associated flavoprotein CzcO
VLPRPDLPLPRWLQRLFAWIPPLRLAVRGAVYLQLEALSLALLKPRTAFWARWLARRQLRTQVPDAARRASLTPNYPIGCKRIALSNDFYPALMQSHVDLETSAIAAIEPEGVRLSDGRLVELDVLVYATGFRPMDVLSNVQVQGEDGTNLSDYWRDRPVTANGIAVPGFPNLFFLLGPNTALGHNSVLYMIESQARHIAQLMSDARDAGKHRIRATSSAETAFMREIDAAFPGTAWAGGCTSWYVDKRGHNIALWVGPSLAYRWRLRHARRRDYTLD